MKAAGVYTITAPSGRFYVGSAVNFGARWSIHKHHLKNSTHHNRPLQAAWDKYNGDLVFKPILICSPEDTVFYEQKAIDGLNPQMNVCKVAGKTLGYRHTDETKAKFHLRRKATITEEGRLKRSIASKGRKVSDETREKIRQVRLGTKRSAETCRKISERQMGGKRKPHSEETKAKMRIAQKLCNEKRIESLKETVARRNLERAATS